MVARCYGVSSKTVRDIWDKKSWARYTIGLEMRVEPMVAQESKNGENTNKDALGIERKHKNMIDLFSTEYDWNGAMLAASSQDSATSISMRCVYGGGGE